MELLTEKGVCQLLQKQKEFFASGQTLPITFRIEMLHKLKNAILANQSKLEQALFADLGKSRQESYSSEIGSFEKVDAAHSRQVADDCFQLQKLRNETAIRKRIDHRSV